jgi:hypothetical protein
MGLADVFGFGKKEEKKKPHFSFPAEVSAISTSIDAENRENYPKLDRYREIVKRVNAVQSKLDAIIAQGEHAEEATWLKEEIRRKMGQLTEKVNMNLEAVKKEKNDDYIASDLAYLERKGMRNHAKTLFTECLDAMESLMNSFKENSAKNGTTLELAAGEFIRAMSALDTIYFKKHADDHEISHMREELQKRIIGLQTFFTTNADVIREQGLEDRAKAVLAEIARAIGKLSGI